MKKKQPLSLPPGVIKHTPEDFPRPDPMALATLAAILEPGHPPRDGLGRAMRFYFAAVLFTRELPGDYDDLVGEYGTALRNEERIRRRAAKALHQKWEANALKLEPKKDEDEARRFLNEKARRAGVIVKREHLFRTAEQLLKVLQAYYESLCVSRTTTRFHLTSEAFIESMRRTDDNGDEYYLIPRDWLAAETRLPVKNTDGSTSTQDFFLGVLQFHREQISEVRKRAAQTKKRNREDAAKPVKKNPQKKSDAETRR